MEIIQCSILKANKLRDVKQITLEYFIIVAIISINETSFFSKNARKVRIYNRVIFGAFAVLHPKQNHKQKKAG